MFGKLRSLLGFGEDAQSKEFDEALEPLFWDVLNENLKISERFEIQDVIEGMGSEVQKVMSQKYPYVSFDDVSKEVLSKPFLKKAFKNAVEDLNTRGGISQNDTGTNVTGDAIITGFKDSIYKAIKQVLEQKKTKYWNEFLASERG